MDFVISVNFRKSHISKTMCAFIEKRKEDVEERESDPKMKPLTGTISHGNAQMGQVFKHCKCSNIFVFKRFRVSHGNAQIMASVRTFQCI